MKDATQPMTILERLKVGTKASSDTDLGRKLGVGQQSISNARNLNKVPDSWIHKAAEGFGLSADWLLFGEGAMYRTEAPPPPPVEAMVQEPLRLSSKERKLPVIGLAACSLKGWYNTGSLALSVSVPIEYATPAMFAVLAVGMSMQPGGIRQGHVALCDPDVPPEAEQPVFIKKKDGTASIKLYRGQNEQWLILQGWLDPSEDGTQKAYTEQLALDTVAQIASVVMVRIRS